MTTYWVRVRYHATGHEAVLTYDASTTRELAIILVSAYADVIERGMGTTTETVQ